MAIAIEKVDVKKGESLLVTFSDSPEHAVAIAWDSMKKLPFIKGPMNRNAKKFTVSIYGIEEVKGGGMNSD